MKSIEVTPKLIPNPPKGMVKWLVWALFKNEDDGEIGDRNWNPEQKDSWKIRILWWIRNPAHNLCFFVIGMAGEPGVRVGDYPGTVFNPHGGWNRCTHYSASGRRAKFVSYIGRIKFYFGVRERGNFGIKLTLNSA